MSIDKTAFNPTGNTITFTANTSAPTGVLATSGGYKTNQYRVHNAGTNTAFIAVSDVSGAAAASAAVIPTGTSQPSYPIPGGAIEIWSLPPNVYFSGITASGTSIVYVTPGRGY